MPEPLDPFDPIDEPPFRRPRRPAPRPSRRPPPRRSRRNRDDYDDRRDDSDTRPRIIHPVLLWMIAGLMAFFTLVFAIERGGKQWRMPWNAGPALPPPLIDWTQGDAPSFQPVSKEALPKYTGPEFVAIPFAPSAIRSAAVGGRGRYLFVFASTEPGIQVIDLTTGKRDRTIPYAATSVHSVKLLAGADVLVAVNEDYNGDTTSWSIPDFGAPRTAKVGFFMGNVFLGSESNGPLVYCGLDAARAPTAMLDPVTLRPVSYGHADDADRGEFRSGTIIAVSPDGTLLCTEESGHFSPLTFWRVGPASISKAKTALKLNRGMLLSLAADNDTVSTWDGLFRLSTGASVRDAPGFRSVSRAFSQDSKEAIFVVPGGGFDSDIYLWKPGSDERVARLRGDPQPDARIHAEAKHTFYVARTGTAVLAGPQGVGIWHAEPRKPPAPEKGD